MFTLCTKSDTINEKHDEPVNLPVVKSGHLLLYKRGLLNKIWLEQWFILYKDCTLAWYKNEHSRKPCGSLKVASNRIRLIHEEALRNIPEKPRIPYGCQLTQLWGIAIIGKGNYPRKILWLLAQSTAEVRDWLIAIQKTLPSSSYNQPMMYPPRVSNETVQQPYYKTQRFSAEHTVLAGAAFGWGNQTTGLMQNVLTAPGETPSVDCLNDYNEMDWCTITDLGLF